MSLNHSWIEAHIPHKGSMCLLESVEEWSREQIRCRSNTHRDADNPLRARGILGSASGIEYAAQAMAVHGALLAEQDGPARVGYLTSVRGVRMHVGRLDDIEAELDIHAERITGDDNNILYNFTVSAGGRLLLEGRAAVVLNAAKLAPAAS